ncbi:MAG: hypothetical protein ACJ754_09500 [Pyrinomonadaceae bacterium]
MKQSHAIRLFPALILAAGLVLASSVARVSARQEKSEQVEATQPKPSPEAKKPETAQTAGTPEPAQEKMWGPYVTTSSIEFGVRGMSVDGNGDKFRSDYNYDPGFKLFDASLLMKSNGAGVLFDELMLNTFGWSGDPNRHFRLDVTKTNLYKFNANYRRIHYFNSLTNFAAPAPIPNSQHAADTEYRQGDFDLTLWPTSPKFRLNLGYSLDFNSGPALSTSRYSSDEFPVLAPVRVAAHDYRIGFDTKLWVFDISFMQGYRVYKEDTTYFIDAPQAGNNATNKTVIETYRRDVPTRGRLPYTRFSLHTLLAKRLDFTGRYVYTSGTTDYGYFDNLSGTNKDGRRVTSDAITVLGDAKRPHAIGDLSATFAATRWLRISDSFRFQNFRINGGDIFNEVAQVPTATPPVTVTDKREFATTNYRRFVNTVEGDVDLNKRLSFHLGYRFTDRHIEQLSQSITPGQTPSVTGPELFDNQTHTFLAGFKAKPVKEWTLYFDIEQGNNDNVFTRTANYDYTNVRARSIVRLNQKFRFNASLITRDNTNPTVINGREFGASIDTRIFSGSMDWFVNERLNLTGGYTYFHATSDIVVQFNSANGVVNFGPAQYFTREHFAFLTAYWQPHHRVNIYGSFRINNDRGQGDRVTTPLVFVNSYPYQLASPEVKVSFKLRRNVDWITGYQYIDYKERFANNQFYQAHLPYTSLRLYFGRAE